MLWFSGLLAITVYFGALSLPHKHADDSFRMLLLTSIFCERAIHSVKRLFLK